MWKATESSSNVCTYFYQIHVHNLVNQQCHWIYYLKTVTESDSVHDQLAHAGHKQTH